MQYSCKENGHVWSAPKVGDNDEVIYWCETCDATKDSDGGIIN